MLHLSSEKNPVISEMLELMVAGQYLVRDSGWVGISADLALPL